MDAEEIDALAGHVDLQPSEFTSRFLRTIDGRTSLRERQNLDCIFYRSDIGCSVYSARPHQCRTYPFWGKIIANEEQWCREAEFCPGIDDRETRVSADEILALSSGRGAPEKE